MNALFGLWSGKKSRGSRSFVKWHNALPNEPFWVMNAPRGFVSSSDWAAHLSGKFWCKKRHFLPGTSVPAELFVDCCIEANCGYRTKVCEKLLKARCFKIKGYSVCFSDVFLCPYNQYYLPSSATATGFASIYSAKSSQEESINLFWLIQVILSDAWPSKIAKATTSPEDSSSILTWWIK